MPFGNLVSHLVPFPRLHFMRVAEAPLISHARALTHVATAGELIYDVMYGRPAPTTAATSSENLRPAAANVHAPGHKAFQQLACKYMYNHPDNPVATAYRWDNNRAFMYPDTVAAAPGNWIACETNVAVANHLASDLKNSHDRDHDDQSLMDMSNSMVTGRSKTADDLAYYSDVKGSSSQLPLSMSGPFASGRVLASALAFRGASSVQVRY